MIAVIAKKYVKAEKTEEFLKIAKELVEATNKLDEGCISYDLYKDPKEPNVYTILEHWESYKALEDHTKAKHFTDIIPKLGGFMEKPGETNVYEKLV